MLRVKKKLQAYPLCRVNSQQIMLALWFLGLRVRVRALSDISYISD
jgi:hypothetical protein